MGLYMEISCLAKISCIYILIFINTYCPSFKNNFELIPFVLFYVSGYNIKEN